MKSRLGGLRGRILVLLFTNIQSTLCKVFSGGAMSDGEGKGSRMGDIVLFASWHHNQEEEEEDVEGETEECHGLKRAAQTAGEGSSSKRARRTTEDLIFGIPPHREEVPPHREEVPPRREEDHPHQEESPSHQEEEREVDEIKTPILELSPSKRIILEKKSKLNEHGCGLDDVEDGKGDDNDTFDRLLQGSQEIISDSPAVNRMDEPMDTEGCPAKRDSTSPRDRYNFDESRTLLLSPRKFQNMVGDGRHRGNSDKSKHFVESRPTDNAEKESKSAEDMTERKRDDDRTDAVIEISDEDEEEVRKKAKHLELSDEWGDSVVAEKKEEVRTKVCKVIVNKLSKWEVAHGKARVQRVGVRRREVLQVLERMYHDSEGHLWSKVMADIEGSEVDKEASVLVDLIEQHVRDCTSCRKNPAFSCSGQSSRQHLEAKVQALEEKVEQLKAKLRRVEREGVEEDHEVTSSLLSGVTRPKLLPNTEYFVASGLRLVDLSVVRSIFAALNHHLEQPGLLTNKCCLRFAKRWPPLSSAGTPPSVSLRSGLLLDIPW